MSTFLKIGISVTREMTNHLRTVNNIFYFYFLIYKYCVMHFVACFTAKQGIAIDIIKSNYFVDEEIEHERKRTHLYLVRKLSVMFRFLQPIVLIPLYFV